MLADTKEKQITWEDMEVVEEPRYFEGLGDTAAQIHQGICEEISRRKNLEVTEEVKRPISEFEMRFEQELIYFDESVSFSLNDYEFLVGVCTPSRVKVTGS